MKKMLRPLLLLLLLCSTAAAAAPASEATIRELLTVTQVAKLLDGIWGQFDGITQNAVKMAMAGEKPSAEQQQVIDRMVRRSTQVVREEMSWQKLEPIYIRLYQESFTEDEMQAMLAFYRTPTGQALIEKMPALTKRTMVEVQAMTVGMMPRLQEVLRDFAAEMKAAQPAAKAPAAQSPKTPRKTDL